MTILFFLKPHYPQHIRSLMQRRPESKKRKRRVYKILRTTTYPQAEEVSYFDEVQFGVIKSEQRRVEERQRVEDEDMLLLAMMEAA